MLRICCLCFFTRLGPLRPTFSKPVYVLNAACLTNAKVSELPFTTIDPNKGVAYVKTECVCKELEVEDNPKNSLFFAQPSSVKKGVAR